MEKFSAVMSKLSGLPVKGASGLLASPVGSIATRPSHDIPAPGGKGLSGGSATGPAGGAYAANILLPPGCRAMTALLMKSFMAGKLKHFCPVIQTRVVHTPS